MKISEILLTLPNLIVEKINWLLEKIKNEKYRKIVKITLICVAIISLIALIIFLLYSAVMRNAALGTPGKQFNITEFTKGIGDALKGQTKSILGYSKRSFGEHALNIFSLLIVSCLTYLIFLAFTKMFTVFLGESRKVADKGSISISIVPERLEGGRPREYLRKARKEQIAALEEELEKLEGYKGIFGIWKRWWVILILWFVLIVIYILISFVPIINNLQPILSPIYSDYGESYALAVAGLKNQILLLFGRTIEPNAQIGFWNNVLPTLKLIGKKVISTTTWLVLLGLLIYYVPWVIKRTIENYLIASEEIEMIKREEEKEMKKLEVTQGIKILKAIRNTAP